jgi:ketosteroid isomerase-like protein
MPSQGAQLLRLVVQEFNDTGRLGPLFDVLMHPDLEFKDEIGAYSTRREVREFLEGFADAIGGLQVDIQHLHEVDDTVVLDVIQSGRGSSSGIPVEQPFTWVLRFQDERCTWWRIYASRDQALEELKPPQ